VATVTREILPDASVAVTGAHVLPGAGRNLLLERARGELLLFLDDDVTIPEDMLRRLADLAAAHPDVAVFGGPNETSADSTRFQSVQGAVLASILGGGPVRKRYGAHTAGPADECWFTLCNLAVRRRVMRPFAVDLTCAEENDVLDQLQRDGQKMWYDPRLLAFHERRDTIGGFARQMHKYGRGRGELTARRPSSLRPSFLGPPALVLYLLIAMVLAAVAPLVLAPLMLYLAAVTGAALMAGFSARSASAVPLAGLLFVVLHVCYGAGIWRGLMPSRSRPEPKAVWLPARHQISVEASS
jgi:hypothetical protein